MGVGRGVYEFKRGLDRLYMSYQLGFVPPIERNILCEFALIAQYIVQLKQRLTCISQSQVIKYIISFLR